MLRPSAPSRQGLALGAAARAFRQMRLQLERGGEIQLTDGMRLLTKEKGLWAYRYEGTCYDAGDKLGFLKATVELGLLNSELGTAFREYLRTLKL